MYTSLSHYKGVDTGQILAQVMSFRKRHNVTKTIDRKRKQTKNLKGRHTCTMGIQEHITTEKDNLRNYIIRFNKI